jgi:hypothetical protein
MVNVARRINLTPPSADDGYICVLLREPHGSRKPTVRKLAIAVNELDELELGSHLEQSPPASVAAAGCGKRLRPIELNRLRTMRPRTRNRTICRTAVDIDHWAASLRNRGKTSLKPFAFVTPNNNDAHFLVRILVWKPLSLRERAG